MGSKNGKSEISSSNSINLNHENNQAMIYTLLKVFNIFINTIKEANNGEVDLVCSILRDYSQNWNDFYDKLFPFSEPFIKKLNELDELKIETTIEKSKKRKLKKNILKMEFKYSDDSEDVNNCGNQLQVVLYSKQKSEGISVTSSVTDLPSFSVLHINRRYLNPLTFIQLSEHRGSHFGIFLLILKKKLQSKKGQEIYSEKRNLTETADLTVELYSSQETIGSPETELELNEYIEETEESNTTSSFFDEILHSLQPNKASSPYFNNDSYREEMSLFEEQLNEKVRDFKEKEKMSIEKSEATSVLDMNEQDLDIDLDKKNDDFDKENIEYFERLLEEQKQKQREELEKIQKQRREKKMKYDAELNEFRQKQKQRFVALIQCIIMQKRFEEKEEVWSDWIENSFKKLVVRNVNQLQNFLNSTRNHTHFNKLHRDSPDDWNLEISNLNRGVIVLFDDLENIFCNLNQISQIFNEVLFIRVLQESVCDIASKLNDISNVLEEIEYSFDWYQRLENEIDDFKPYCIPTCKELRNICKLVNISDYAHLEFPKCDRLSCVKIVEEDMQNSENGEQEENNRNSIIDESSETLNTLPECDNVMKDNEIISKRGDESGMSRSSSSEISEDGSKETNVRKEPVETFMNSNEYKCEEIEKSALFEPSSHTSHSKKLQLSRKIRKVSKTDNVNQFSKRNTKLKLFGSHIKTVRISKFCYEPASFKNKTSQLQRANQCEDSSKRLECRENLIYLYKCLTTSNGYPSLKDFITLTISQRRPMLLNVIRRKHQNKFVKLVPIWNSIFRNVDVFMKFTEFTKLLGLHFHKKLSVE